MPYDWNNPYDSIVAFDVGNPVSVSLTGIATAEAFGSANLIRADKFTASLFGIPSAEAFGITSVSSLLPVSLSGIASAETFGSLLMNTASAVSLTGIPSAEAFGSMNMSQPGTFPTRASRVL